MEQWNIGRVGTVAFLNINFIQLASPKFRPEKRVERLHIAA